MAALFQTPLKTNPAYREMTVEEFLGLEFEGRAELEDGHFYMMTGGTVAHAAIIANITIALGSRLRGSNCRVFGPDLLVRTAPSNIRSPDVSVYCGVSITGQNRREKLLGDPKVVVEVLSPSTQALDQRTKLPEYVALNGVEAVLIVDPETERVRIVERLGADDWHDHMLPTAAEVTIGCLGLTIPADEIFAGS